MAGLQAKVEGHQLCWLDTWEDLSEAADYPVTNAIIEWAVYQGMQLITQDILSTQGTLGAGDCVAENSVQSFLGGQKIVQQAEREAGVY